MNGASDIAALEVPAQLEELTSPRFFDLNESLRLPRPMPEQILVIGWRATEDHFLELLRRHLRRAVYTSIAGKDEGDADGTRVVKKPLCLFYA